MSNDPINNTSQINFNRMNNNQEKTIEDTIIQALQAQDNEFKDLSAKVFSSIAMLDNSNLDKDKLDNVKYNEALIKKNIQSILKNGIKKFEDNPNLSIVLPSNNQTKSVTPTGTYIDPIDLISDIYTQYGEQLYTQAEALANNINTLSTAIADINQTWNLLMQDRLPHTDSTNDGTKTALGGSTVSSNYLSQINDIIINDIGDPNGISEITGMSLADSETEQVSYTQLQTMNATMSAYCDNIRVTIDSEQQQFQNISTQLTSVQQQIVDLRSFMVQIAQK